MKEIVFQRANPEELAKFDPSTKVCTMNCGPHSADPRSDKERKLLCDECLLTSNAHELKAKRADDRAHRIASIASEELIRSEGEATSGIDEFAIPQCQSDGHMRECIAHLCWHGEAVSHETDEGYIVVQLGDFTMTSLT